MVFLIPILIAAMIVLSIPRRTRPVVHFLVRSWLAPCGLLWGMHLAGFRIALLLGIDGVLVAFVVAVAKGWQSRSSIASTGTPPGRRRVGVGSASTMVDSRPT